MNRTPLEGIEKVYVAIHPVPPDVMGWIILDHPLDIPLLNKAIHETIKEFPWLASRITLGWGGPFFERVEISSLPLEVIKVDSIRIDQEPDILKDFFRTPLNIFKGPLVKFVLIQSAGNSILGISVNHTACDARGMRCLLHALAERYSALQKGEDSGRPLERQDRSMRVLYRGRPVFEILKMIGFSIRQFFWLLTPGRPDRLEECTVPVRMNFTALYFHGEEARQIINLSRRSGVTVNDLLLASLVISYTRCLNRSRLIRFYIPQDLRPLQKKVEGIFWEEGYGWLPVGNVVGGFFVDFQKQEMLRHSKLTRLTSAKLGWHKKNQSTLKGNYLICHLPRLPMSMLKWLGRREGVNVGGRLLKVTTVFSNIGAIPAEFLKFGNALPVRFDFVMPQVGSAGVAVAASGVGESISVVLTHPEGYEPAKRFAEILREEILKRE